MTPSTLSERPALPGGLTPAVLQQALTVLANEATQAADLVQTLAEAQRNGAPMTPKSGGNALAGFRAWEAAYALMSRLASYGTEGALPPFRRPTEEDVLDSLRLGDDPEIRAGVAAWARRVDAAIILRAGYSDGQRVLPAFVAPWGYNILAWCGHRWNMHGATEGPRTPHYPICHTSDDAPLASGYYVVPVDDPEGFRLALQGYRHAANGVPREGRPYRVRLGPLLDWRRKQGAVAARGFVAPLADVPRSSWPEGWQWAS